MARKPPGPVGFLDHPTRHLFFTGSFDTAPTGHTLRLLSLPKAWTAFLDGNVRGASCLGPQALAAMPPVR